jgi:hypothetical protein
MLIRRIILPIRPKLHQWTCYVISGDRWHLSVLPTLLRSYPTGQARRKEKGRLYIGMPLRVASTGESRQIHCEQCTSLLGPNRPHGW